MTPAAKGGVGFLGVFTGLTGAAGLGLASFFFVAAFRESREGAAWLNFFGLFWGLPSAALAVAGFLVGRWTGFSRRWLFAGLAVFALVFAGFLANAWLTGVWG